MSISKRESLLQERSLPKQSVPKNTEWMEEQCPVLLDMLTIIPKGGEGHKTTSVLIFCDEGEIKILIHDRAIGRKAWVRLERLDDKLLQLLEDVVTDDCTDWRYPRNEDNGSR